MTGNCGLDRRELLYRALVLAGASAAASACQTMDVIAAAPADTAGGLSSAQMATLTAAAGQIIPLTDTPGAVEAGVPERFNGLMIDWASPSTRAAMERVLADIDGLSGDGRSYAALSRQEQHDLLAAHDDASMQPSEKSEAVFFASRRLPMDPDYGRFKDLIVTLYYMSQEALTQELVYTHVPGRWDPSIPVTRETRPWASFNVF